MGPNKINTILISEGSSSSRSKDGNSVPEATSLATPGDPRRETTAEVSGRPREACFVPKALPPLPPLLSAAAAPLPPPASPSKQQLVTMEAEACHASLSSRSSGRPLRGVDGLQEQLHQLAVELGRLMAGVDGVQEQFHRRTAQSGRLMEEVNGLQEQFNGLAAQSGRMSAVMESWMERLGHRETEAMLDFISSERFGKTHAFLSDTRTAGTGDWLVESEEFRRWQDADSGSAVLCLNGTIGAGKTYLTSRVVDHVKGAMKTTEHHEGFAYFYCTRNASLLQDPLIVLRSLVRQLCIEASDSSPDGAEVLKVVKQRCDLAKREGRDLSWKDCNELVLESLNLYSKSTIILDALDESDVSLFNLANILIELKDRSEHPVKIFISTRPDREYMAVFDARSIITVDASAQQRDIERYLAEKLYEKEFFKKMSQSIQEKIKETFQQRNGGMFRWVELQTKLLQKRVSEDAIIEWTRTVPEGLVEAYREMWKRIEQDNDAHDVDLAKRAIAWALTAILPLSVEELLTVLAPTVKGLRDGSRDRPTAQQILGLCQDFLTIDTAGDIWTAPHASVTEYFNSKRSRMGNCHQIVCSSILKLLSDPDAEARFEDCRIGKLIDCSWPLYLKAYEEALSRDEDLVADKQFSEALMRFLGSPAEGSRHYRAWRKRQGKTDSPATLMANMGIYHVLSDWWMSDKMLAQQRSVTAASTSPIQRPLSAILTRAASSVGIVDPRAIWGGYNPALFLALARNELDKALDIMRDFARSSVEGKDWQIDNFCSLYLVKTPARLLWFLTHARSWIQTTPTDQRMSYLLYLAVTTRSLKSLEILIRSGADVNQTVLGKGNLLHLAVSSRQSEALELLLQAGASPQFVDRAGKHASALAEALHASSSLLLRFRFRDRSTMQAIVVKLLEHKADPSHSVDHDEYGSPLEALAQNIVRHHPDEINEHIHMIDLLLDAGADAAKVYQGGQYGSALVCLAVHGRLALVQRLVNHIGKDAARQTLQGRSFPQEIQPLEDTPLSPSQLAKTKEYLEDEMGLVATENAIVRFLDKFLGVLMLRSILSRHVSEEEDEPA